MVLYSTTTKRRDAIKIKRVISNDKQRLIVIVTPVVDIWPLTLHFMLGDVIDDN